MGVGTYRKKAIKGDRPIMKKLNRYPLKKRQIFETKRLLSVGVWLILLTGVLFAGCSNKTVQFLDAEMEKEEIAQLTPSVQVEAELDSEVQVEQTGSQAGLDEGSQMDSQAESDAEGKSSKVTDTQVVAQMNVSTDINDSDSELIYIYVCGAVLNPGVYEMETGSRVFQAVELAGGLLDEAAPEYVNQAMTVSDGQQIYIPSLNEIEQLDGSGSGSNFLEITGMSGTAGNTGNAFSDGAGADTSSDKVNINTADKAELMTISGIGESRAQDIIAYRESNGGFSTIEEIMNVPGIKEATFEKIKDGIEVK